MEEERNGLRTIERSGLQGTQNRSRMTRQRSASRRRGAPPRSPTRRPARRRRSPLWRLGVLSAVVLGIIIILLTTTFSSATLRLMLASADASVDGVFSAIREPAQSADIAYSRIGPFTDSRSSVITDITRERENSYAEGTIMVFNVHTERLDLVNRTRFQTKGGQIYRLTGKQSIPGGRTVNGEFVPGRKEVRVVADSIGDEYNLRGVGVRFSIPGLAKYRELADSYAESTSTIIGGFSGERFIPNEEKEQSERARLRREIAEKLEQNLVEALQTDTLSERIVFNSAKFIEYESLENEQTADAVVLHERGTLYAVSFREAALASLLVRSGVNSAVPTSVSPVQVSIGNLNMEFVDPEFNPTESTEFDFRLSGTAKVFWGIDETLFLGDIAGKRREVAEDITLREYPQVEQITALSVFPVWRLSLPGNRRKITLDISYEREQQARSQIEDGS